MHRNIKHILHVYLKPVKHFTAAVFNYRAMKCIYDYLADMGTASKTSADSVHVEQMVNIQNHDTLDGIIKQHCLLTTAKITRCFCSQAYCTNCL